MFSRQLPWWSLLGVSALVASLVLPGVGHADNKKAPPPKKGPAGPPAGATLPFEEAETLRKVFLLLAGANHDYNGHRVKAMHAVKEAINHLDGQVMKHGTASQKAATRSQNAGVAQAAEAARRAPTVHERQPASDAQLRQASQLLGEVRTTMAGHKQQLVVGLVGTALKQIGSALKVR